MDVYAIVTSKIIEQMEKGVIPWHKPWFTNNSNVPINYVTRKPYRGINLMLLDKGGEWLTFNQCRQAGGTIKKGEKSSIIVFYSMFEKNTEENKKKKEDEKEYIPFLKYSNVFHISQCEGIESKIIKSEEENTDIEPIANAEFLLQEYTNRENIKLNITDSNDAFYSPNSDSITLPKREQYKIIEEFYSTAFHEVAHSTGNKKRLNRFTTGEKFGNTEYSKEELVAEISTAFVLNRLNIDSEKTFENSVAYLKGWLAKLKNDNRFIVSASSKAQKAVDFIFGD